MDKKTSDALVKLFEAVKEKHGVTEWGVLYVDGRWTVGLKIGYTHHPGSGETPQEAYENALHDIAGTSRPPF